MSKYGRSPVSYPNRYELYKRVEDPFGKEKYVIVVLSTFPVKPSTDEVNDVFEGKPRNESKKAVGFCQGIRSNTCGILQVQCSAMLF
ncbi:hypothetical protein ACFX15_016935 [Malus domestica]